MLMPIPKRRRKIGALASIGSLVGVTTVVSLAAWSGTTFLSGKTTLASYTGIEATTVAGTWPSSTADPSITALSITFPSAVLAEKQSAYSAIAVRAKQGTDVDVPATIYSLVSSGTAAGLTYSIIETADFGCTKDSTATSTIVPALTPIIHNTATGSFTLAKASATAAGEPTYLCLKITANDTADTVEIPNVQWVIVAGWVTPSAVPTATPTP